MNLLWSRIILMHISIMIKFVLTSRCGSLLMLTLEHSSIGRVSSLLFRKSRFSAHCLIVIRIHHDTIALINTVAAVDVLLTLSAIAIASSRTGDCVISLLAIIFCVIVVVVILDEDKIVHDVLEVDSVPLTLISPRCTHRQESSIG